MSKIIILPSLCFLAVSMQIALIYSERSQEFLLPEAKGQKYKQFIIRIPVELNTIIEQGFDIVYDLTFEPLFSLEIHSIVGNHECEYLNGYLNISDFRFLGFDLKAESRIMKNLLDFLGITNYATFYSLSLYEFFEEVITESSHKVIVEDGVSIDSIKLHIADLKFSGISTIFLLLPPNTSSIYIQNSPTSTYLWLLPDSCDILLFESPLPSSSSILRLTQSTSYSSLLHELISSLSQCAENLFLTCIHNFKKNPFQVLKISQKAYQKIGECKEKCEIFQGFSWNTTLDPQIINRQNLIISYESCNFNPENKPLDYLKPVYQGVQLAINYTLNLSKKFIITGNPVCLGGNSYNSTFFHEALKENLNFGVVLISPALSELAIKTYENFDNLSISLPMIGYSNTVSRLSSSFSFPYYTRLCMPDTYMSVILAMACKYFNWFKVGVLYTDNLFASELYKDFKAQAELTGIEILNKVNIVKNDGNFEDFDSVLHVLGKSEARIIVIFCFPDEISEILVRMYELGYYGDDYEYIAAGWLLDEVINPNNSFNKSKVDIIRNSLKGSLTFAPVSFVDQFGIEIEDLYRKTFESKPIDFTAFAFDAVLAIFYNLEFLIESKRDYENKNVFMKYFRDLRVKGSTGLVTFKQGTNDRSPIDHFIFNTIQVDDEWKIEMVGMFSPTGFQVFNFYKNLTWKGKNVPNDTPEEFYCGFSLSGRKIYFNGLIFYLCSQAFISVISLITVFIGIRKWNKFPVKNIENCRFQMSFTDMMNLMKIFYDFLQYLSLFSSLPLLLGHRVSSALKLITLDASSIYFENPRYFQTFYFIINSLVSVSIITRLLNKMKINSTYLQVFSYFISEFLFIPILSSLIDIYQCQYFSPSSFNYLNSNCRMKCFTFPHTIYVSFTSINLFIYSTFLLFEKPWYSSGLSIDQTIVLSPKHSLIKAYIQILLVFTYKISNFNVPYLYCSVFIVLICFYLVFSFIVPGFNLKLLNLWNVLAHLAILSAGIIILYLESSKMNEGNTCTVVLAVVWGVLFLIGIIVKKIKKFSWPFAGGVDSNLLKFAFNKSMRYSIDFFSHSMVLPSTRSPGHELSHIPRTSTTFLNLSLSPIKH